MYLEKVKRFISDNYLLETEEKVIVAVSGGADSMALLHLLHSLGYTCIAAHCNFNLRGEESDNDEKFVSGYCTENNIELHTKSFDTYSYMNKKSVSLEMAARELRYRWFDELCKQVNTSKIAIAHHKDDSVETILINLIRGSGIKGLTGIPVKNENIIRPLLCLNKNDITIYIQANSIPYVTDNTNFQDIYLRNKLRLKIIPQLEEINPAFKRTIAQTAEHLAGIETIYNTAIQTIKNKIFRNNEIDIKKLLETESPKTLLFEILHPYGFNSAAIDSIYESTGKIPGKKFFSPEYCLIKDRNTFILEKIQEKQQQVFYIENENISELTIPVKLKIEILTNETGEIEKNKNILYADHMLINFPLSIRKWEYGDKFIPFGMNGSKKLSDYFNDRKFSIPQKENIWLLCNSNKEIIWIIGERPDNRFRITKKTKNILKIELLDS